MFYKRNTSTSQKITREKKTVLQSPKCQGTDEATNVEKQRMCYKVRGEDLSLVEDKNGMFTSSITTVEAFSQKEISGQVFEEIIGKSTTGFKTLSRNMHAHIHF